MDKKGLIVIGSGMTGLSAGLAWAKNVDVSQRPVLMLEKESEAGGFATSYTKGGFKFDVLQIIPDISELLEYFGVNIELKKFQGYCLRIFIADSKTGKLKIIKIPAGYTEFGDMLIQEYPHQAKQIEKFLSFSHAMYKELFNLKVEPGLFQLLKTLFTCPKIVKNAGKTFKEYFDPFGITDPDLLGIFDVFVAFGSLPADRVASIVPVVALISTLDGSFRPKQGFIDFSLALKNRFIEFGGEIRTNAKVEKILIEGDAVKGIRLAGGEEILADNIITTVETKVAMKELVGMETLKRIDTDYAAKVEKARMSTSSFNINLGLDDRLDLAALGFDCGYNLLSTGNGAFEKLFEAFEKNEMGFTDDCFHTAVICPSLTTGGKPNITIRVVPMPMADWLDLRNRNREAYDSRKEKIADFFIEKVEKYMIPNLRKHILIKDISSPATYSSLSGSPTGSIYDMAPYPDNFGMKRLKMRTPVKGLFQPKFAHGIWACMQGGMQAVDMILQGRVMNGNSRFKN